MALQADETTVEVFLCTSASRLENTICIPDGRRNNGGSFPVHPGIPEGSPDLYDFRPALMRGNPCPWKLYSRCSTAHAGCSHADVHLRRRGSQAVHQSNCMHHTIAMSRCADALYHHSTHAECHGGHTTGCRFLRSPGGLPAQHKRQ